MYRPRRDLRAPESCGSGPAYLDDLRRKRAKFSEDWESNDLRNPQASKYLFTMDRGASPPKSFENLVKKL